MRLICPNCSAQYEIDGALIPEEGREVQCSNCGNTWFELPPVTAGSPPPELDVEDQTEPEAEPEPSVASDGAPETDTSETDEDESWEWPDPDSPKIAEPAAAADETDRPRRPADLAALEILKEEADRELAKRKGEDVEPLATQQDLDLNDPRDRDTPSRALRARMARLRGEEDTDIEEAEDEAAEAEAYVAPRKDLLPDMDEINSSLRPAGLAPGQRTEHEEASHRQGFRMGFIGIVALAVLAIVAYAQAPSIATVLPGTEAAMIGYVDWANGLRDAVSGLAGG